MTDTKAINDLKCNSCIHSFVCSYKSNLSSLHIKALEAVNNANSSVDDIHNIYSVSVDCNQYKRKQDDWSKI